MDTTPNKIPRAHHQDNELPKPQAHQLHLSMSCNCGSSTVCCTTQQTKSCIPTGMSTTLSRNWTTHEHELHNREVDHLVNTCNCGKSRHAQRACQDPRKELHCGITGLHSLHCEPCLCEATEKNPPLCR